jgi:hypothetical protein
LENVRQHYDTADGALNNVKADNGQRIIQDSQIVRKIIQEFSSRSDIKVAGRTPYKSVNHMLMKFFVTLQNHNTEEDILDAEQNEVKNLQNTENNPEGLKVRQVS